MPAVVDLGHFKGLTYSFPSLFLLNKFGRRGHSHFRESERRSGQASRVWVRWWNGSSWVGRRFRYYQVRAEDVVIEFSRGYKKEKGHEA